MKDVLKIGLLGAAGWFLWQWLRGSSTPVATVPPGTNPPAMPPITTPPATTPPPVSTTSSGSNLGLALTQAMAANWNPQAGQSPTFTGTATVSQWNWVMNNVTNPGSAPAMLSYDPAQEIDVNTYISARSAAGYGLSGFAGRRNYVRRGTPMRLR